MFVRVALAMIHDMDVGKTTRARLTAPAWEGLGGLPGVTIVCASILGDNWVSSSEWGGVAYNNNSNI